MYEGTFVSVRVDMPEFNPVTFATKVTNYPVTQSYNKLKHRFMLIERPFEFATATRAELRLSGFQVDINARPSNVERMRDAVAVLAKIGRDIACLLMEMADVLPWRCIVPTEDAPCA